MALSISPLLLSKLRGHFTEEHPRGTIQLPLGAEVVLLLPLLPQALRSRARGARVLPSLRHVRPDSTLAPSRDGGCQTIPFLCQARPQLRATSKCFYCPGHPNLPPQWPRLVHILRTWSLRVKDHGNRCASMNNLESDTRGLCASSSDGVSYSCNNTDGHKT